MTVSMILIFLKCKKLTMAGWTAAKKPPRQMVIETLRKKPHITLKKTYISLKKSSKIIENFTKAQHFLTDESISLEISSKSLIILIKSSYLF
jgi:hypothetical protein